MIRQFSVFRTYAVALMLVFSSGYLFGQEIPLKNWSTPKKLTIGTDTMAAVFIPVTPCRVVDTRGAAGPYGGPNFTPGLTRTFDINDGPCTGIPNPGSYSLNFTIVGFDGGGGFVTAYPAGTARPGTSTINFSKDPIFAVANSAIVPANFTGAIDVFSSGNTALIIDINGYFMNNNGAMNTGDALFLIGSSASSLGLFFINQLDNTVNTSAVQGLLATNTVTGSAGVKGRAGAATGVTYGVLGNTSSTTAQAAGVAGTVGTGGGTSGVLGQTGSATWVGDPTFFSLDVGVKGKGQRGVIGWGSNIGVVGVHVNAAGSGVTYAELGVSDTQGLFVLGNGAVSGNFSIGGTLSKGAGTFKIDHPIDPENKYLYHSFVESPDMMNIYNGVVQLDANGEATVQLPDYFEALNQDFRYQLTAMGRPQPNLYIAEEVNYNMFRISGGRANAKVSWNVTGIRHDVFANAHRVVPEVMKAEVERGFYQHPAERGEPLTKSIEAATASEEMMAFIKQQEAARIKEEDQKH